MGKDRCSAGIQMTEMHREGGGLLPKIRVVIRKYSSSTIVGGRAGKYITVEREYDTQLLYGRNFSLTR